MKVALLLCCSLLINGLTVKEEPKKEPKFAYVAMWLNKVKVPQFVFNHVLSKAETVNLNQAPQMDGAPSLAKGQSIKSSMLEGPKDAKMKAESQKIPLRPRNSQWRGILDVAQNLRDVGSQVPLVVLTNEEMYMNKTLQAENPNLQFIWLNETDFLQRNCKIGAGHEMHFQKLSIWKLTQFDKLLWIDSDVAFAKNVDYIFTSKKFNLKGGARIYGQVDDYQCDGREWSPTSGGVCSGMLLLQPSKLHFQGLMAQQTKMRDCWGDQSIIGSYFHGAHAEARPFDRNIINFARCSKQNGWMDVVHFSGSPNAKRVGDVEKRDKDGASINATVVALKAAQAKNKKVLDEKKALMKAKREKERWTKAAKEGKK